MNGIIRIFKNDKFGSVRTVVNELNEPLFCLADVCQVLDLTPSKAAQRLEDDVLSKYPIIDGLGREQQANFVNEDGLFDVVLDSRKPEAKQFRKWVTSEVLPSIRKHGAYMTAQTITDIIQNPDNMIQLLTALKNEQEQNELLRMQRSHDVKVIDELKPSAEYCNTVLRSNSLISINVIAADLGVTARKLNNLLKDWKVQYKQGDTWLLYANLRDKGFADYKTFHYTDSVTGMPKTSEHLYWTEFGRAFIVAMYDKIINGKPIKIAV